MSEEVLAGLLLLCSSLAGFVRNHVDEFLFRDVTASQTHVVSRRWFLAQQPISGLQELLCCLLRDCSPAGGQQRNSRAGETRLGNGELTGKPHSAGRRNRSTWGNKGWTGQGKAEAGKLAAPQEVRLGQGHPPVVPCTCVASSNFLCRSCEQAEWFDMMLA